MAAKAEEQDLKIVLMHKRFLLKAKDLPGVDRAALQKEVLDAVFAGDLAPMYENLCSELGWPVDAARLATMKANIAKRVEELDAKIKDAEENLGETEVRDALHAKADYLASVGDRAGATAGYTATEAKTAGSGNKMDLVFSQIRLSMYYEDWHDVKKLLAKAKQLCDNGGDWERKNRLKVYQGVFALFTRDFKTAAGLFHEALATFSATELFDYQRVIFYAVITSVIALDRPALKKNVVDSPEVLTAIGYTPHLKEFLGALYGCKYKEFFKAFVEIITAVRSDTYLAPHARYYMREVRVAVYTQFLESYKSVTLASMATAFDVSPGFLDAELSSLIVGGRVNAKIDKVAGVIETSRPDAKSALYHDCIKKGDLLLSRIQKLSKVIDVE